MTVDQVDQTVVTQEPTPAVAAPRRAGLLR